MVSNKVANQFESINRNLPKTDTNPTGPDRNYLDGSGDKLAKDPTTTERLASAPAALDKFTGNTDESATTTDSLANYRSPLDLRFGMEQNVNASAVAPTVPTIGLHDVEGPGGTNLSTTTSANSDTQNPVLSSHQMRNLERAKSDLEAAQALNQAQVDAIDEEIADINDRIATIQNSGVPTPIMADERAQLESQRAQLNDERQKRSEATDELTAALDDVDTLLDVNNQVLQRESELQRLQSQQTSLEQELAQIPDSRDTRDSPPTAVDGLIQNQRESAQNELEDVQRDIARIEKELSQLRSPRTDQRVDIALTQSSIALRHVELVDNGLSPDNSDTYNAADAIGTVYLNPENRRTIERLAEQYDIPPELLAGVVAAELDFDHTSNDRIQDGLGRRGIHGGQGVGASSVHDAALTRALEELTGNVHGFQFNEQVLDKDYRATFTGSVESAAIVLKYLVGEYGNADNLTAQDMSQIWAGFRAGVQGVNDLEGKFGFESVEDWRNGQARGTEEFADRYSEGSNAYLSQPLFVYFASQYR